MISHHSSITEQHIKMTTERNIGVNKTFLEWHPTYSTNLLSPGLVWYVWHVSKGISLFSAALGGVSGGDKSVQGQSRRPITGTCQGREGVLLVLGVSCFLLQTVPCPCTYSSHCMEWVNKEREDITHFSDAFSSSLRAAVLSLRNVHRQKGWLAPLGRHLNTFFFSAENKTHCVWKYSNIRTW